MAWKEVARVFDPHLPLDHALSQIPQRGDYRQDPFQQRPAPGRYQRTWPGGLMPERTEQHRAQDANHHARQVPFPGFFLG